MPTLTLPTSPSPVLRTLADVFARKAGSDVPAPRLAYDDTLPAEGFRIADVGGAVVISAAADAGLVFGVGKYLRTPAWRGTSAPDKPFRPLYFATHFHNWYHNAPLEEIEAYIQELALWGYNALIVWLDLHHYTGIDDPAAVAMIARLKAMLAAANRIGLGAGLLFLANEGYATSPEALRADWRDGQNGYFRWLAHYQVEVCPSIPEGLALILHWQEERLRAFADVDVRYVVLWPYDQGGCTCAACAPWGANGYLRVAEPVARLTKQVFPQAQIVLSTWDFDLTTNGEWEGLASAFATPPDWVDYIMAENRTDITAWPRDHGVPGGLPLVGFPEISMHGMYPWGGYGANPLPAHLERLWGAISHCSAGGMPYSEGYFEDLNKVIHAGFYWQADRPVMEIVREYLAAEFGPDAVEPLARVVTLMEHTHFRACSDDGGVTRYALKETDGVDEVFALVQAVDATLPPAVARGWRWRLFVLRATIDHELAHHDFQVTDACEAAFAELERLYHTTDASSCCVAPPTKARRGIGEIW
jgi:hypothetical protein